MSDKRTFIVISGDLHSCHRHGLLNPATVLEEIDENGNKYPHKPQLNAIQDYLWKFYMSCVEGVAKSANAKDADVIVVMNGDLTAGNKHKQLLVSNRLADQIIIGEANLEPWFTIKQLKAMRIITGTSAHNFEDGSSEILIGNKIKAAHPETSCEVYDHEVITAGDITVDVAHHGPPTGSRNWLRGNVAKDDLQSLMMDDFMHGKIPPRLVVRNRYHGYKKEDVEMSYLGKTYTSTIVICPSFVFVDAYTRQAVRSPAYITHGMICAEVFDGELLRVVPMVRTIDIRTREII